jgi:hypothetical protein
MRPLSATTPLPDRQGGDGSSKENGCEADPYVAGRNIFQQLPFVCLPKQPTDHSGVAGRNIFQQLPFVCLPKQPTDHSGVAGRNIFQQLPFACLPKQPTDHSGPDLVM